MLQLHQVRPASYPQQQLYVDTQGKAKTGQYFPLTLSNHFQFRGFPEGELSAKTPRRSKGPMDVPSMAGAAAFPSSSSPLTQRTSFCRVQTSARAERPSRAVPVPTESILTARRCLLQRGLKPRACRTLHMVRVHAALSSSPRSIAESFCKDYPGTSVGAAGFLLSSSTPLSIPFQEVLADVVVFYVRPGRVLSPEDISLLLVLITALLTS